MHERVSHGAAPPRFDVKEVLSLAHGAVRAERD
jgi:hypothetical protein